MLDGEPTTRGQERLKEVHVLRVGTKSKASSSSEWPTESRERVDKPDRLKPEDRRSTCGSAEPVLCAEPLTWPRFGWLIRLLTGVSVIFETIRLCGVATLPLWYTTLDCRTYNNRQWAKEEGGSQSSVVGGIPGQVQ